MAVKLKFRLSEEDRKEYASKPETDDWFVFDEKALLRMRASHLVLIESLMDGYTIAQMTIGVRNRSSSAMRAVMFIARHQAGIRERWEDFDPQIWAAEFDSVEDDNEPVPTGETEQSPPGSNNTNQSSSLPPGALPLPNFAE